MENTEVVKRKPITDNEIFEGILKTMNNYLNYDDVIVGATIKSHGDKSFKDLEFDSLDVVEFIVEYEHYILNTYGERVILDYDVNNKILTKNHTINEFIKTVKYTLSN